MAIDIEWISKIVFKKVKLQVFNLALGTCSSSSGLANLFSFACQIVPKKKIIPSHDVLSIKQI